MRVRLTTAYLAIVIGAYMVGLGNVWRFPALLLKYGGSGLIAYLISVALLTTLIASVLKVAHVEVGGILEHYERLNFPAFTLFFLVLNVLFLSYYSTVGGLALSSLITSKAPENILWKLLSSLAFILIVFVILMAGKKRVFDIMAISLVAFLVLVSFVIFEMYSYVGNENEILSSFKSLFAVKGFTVEMIADMMAQAAYSLGVGLGFYLIFGSFMPKKASPAIIAVTGAIIDTLASFMGLVLFLLVSAIIPTALITSTGIIFELTPLILSKYLQMPLLKIGFNLTVLLVAITSMVPLGEVAGTVYAKITGLHRTDGMIAVFIMTLFFGTLNVLLLSYNIDAIQILDKTVAVLLFFGTVIEAFGIRLSNVSPVWKYTGYIVSWLVGLVGGVYYLAVSIKEHNYASILVLLALFLLIIASNRPIKNRMRKVKRRQYFSYR